MNFVSNFGENLRKLRRQAGLTQTQLAAEIHTSKSVISFYENQERVPSPAVLVRLAAIFHVSTDYLLGVDTVGKLDISGLDEKDAALLSSLAESLREKNRLAKSTSHSQ